MNDSRNMPYHPISIDRRTVERPSIIDRSSGDRLVVCTDMSNVSTLNGHNSGGRRRLLLYIGDMVQVIDPKSSLMGKFGLVEDIQPRNKDYQVLVKIGKASNQLKFFQLKFCTRISRSEKTTSVPESDKPADSNDNEWSPRGSSNSAVNKVSDYIDEIDDNIGNREGANEKHGIKL